MTGPQVFVLVWGVLAVGLGAFFVFRPEVVEAKYRAAISRNPASKRLGERFAPTHVVIALYRVGGGIFVLIGIAVFVAAMLGVLK